MKRPMQRLSLPALCLAGLLSLAGCQAAQIHGVTDNAHVSSARPALQVTVHDLPLVAWGTGTARLLDANLAGGLPVDAWVSVYAKGPQGPMVAVIQGEIPTHWEWTTVYPRPWSVDAGTEFVGNKSYAACTFLQPADRDPFAGLAGEPVPAQDDPAYRPAYWLVRSLAANYGFGQEKIVIEYREPAPANWGTSLHLTRVPQAELAAFRERALAAFSLSAPQTREVRTAPLGQIRWQYVDDLVLGPVRERSIAD